MAFAFAAFFDHPLNSVACDEVFVGDPDQLQVPSSGFRSKRRLRQFATKEQLAGVIKRDWLVVTDFLAHLFTFLAYGGAALPELHNSAYLVERDAILIAFAVREQVELVRAF